MIAASLAGVEHVVAPLGTPYAVACHLLKRFAPAATLHTTATSPLRPPSRRADLLVTRSSSGFTLPPARIRHAGWEGGPLPGGVAESRHRSLRAKIQLLGAERLLRGGRARRDGVARLLPTSAPRRNPITLSVAMPCRERAVAAGSPEQDMAAAPDSCRGVTAVRDVSRVSAAVRAHRAGRRNPDPAAAACRRAGVGCTGPRGSHPRS